MPFPIPPEDKIIDGQPEAPKPERRWHVDHSRGALNSFDDAPLLPSAAELAGTIALTRLIIELPVEDLAVDVAADSTDDDG